ncbi:MAG: M1 family metallopeptidase [Flavobacteriales bacterium]|nr:M1 family metallopeptidase [Flavobacteriales bacterium]
MKPFLLFLILTFLVLSGIAQDYFQQEVNYTIDVRLDDKEHSLHAFETIEYINNSPDILDTLYFHIWPNAYRNNETALGKQKLAAGGKRMYLDAPHQQGWIDSLDFKVNDESITWGYHSEHFDICILHLKEPLNPGSTIEITTPFYVKLPKGSMSRLGHLEEAYQITQWYPKPAVYDHKGWHDFPYLDIGEFYSEYGSFDVSITVPDNYVVAATGNLQDQGQLLALEERAKATALIEEFDKEDKEFPPSSDDFKTLRYSESNIHDFAWFADKRFHVLKGEVTLPNSGRTVTSWAYFPNHEADLWKDAIEYLNDAVYYYSLWYGDYPYDHVSAVHVPGSRGGMEYPMVTIIGSSSTPMNLETVVMHEVGHNWFYGILGSNERDHPWMDEGINTFSEMRYFNAKYPENRLYKMQLKNEKIAELIGIEDHPFSYIHQLLYRLQARRNMDVPTNSCSEDLVGLNYSAMAYSKTGLSFYYLKEYLGDQTFDQIMKEYYETWKFKHPYPEDLQEIFEKNIEEDLSWFFDDLLSSDKKLNYRISRQKKDRILIKNTGTINSPIPITSSGDQGTQTLRWVPGFEGKKWVDKQSGENGEIRLFGYQYPVLHSSDKRSLGNGLLQKIEPLRFKLTGAVEDPEHSVINLLPVPAWNYHNGFMAGIYFHNDILPISKLEYQIMPLYSFGTNDLAGLAELRYHIHPFSNLFQRISPYIRSKQFALSDNSGDYYQKFNAGILLRFKRKKNNVPLDHELELDFIHATELAEVMNKANTETQFYRLRFRRNNGDRIYPSRFTLDAHGGSEFIKTSAQFDYKHTYIYKNSLDIRIFAGAFLSKEQSLSPVYDFFSSGSAGLNDYTYKGLYLGRALDPSRQLFISNQFRTDQGGLASFSPNASSNEYIIAANVSSSLPITKELPFQFYANAAYLGENSMTKEGGQDRDALIYEGGVKVSLIRNIVDFYFPLIVSEDLDEYLEASTGNYWQKIRFTFNIEKLNFHVLARDL